MHSDPRKYCQVKTVNIKGTARELNRNVVGDLLFIHAQVGCATTGQGQDPGFHLKG